MAASGENLAKARGLYESAWKLYAVVFEKYPELMDNAEAQDLVESVSHYRDVLGQLDEPFPADFPLWTLLDKHQKGQQIRDQVKLLQGRDAPEEKKTEKRRRKRRKRGREKGRAQSRMSKKPAEAKVRCEFNHLIPA